MVLLAGYSPVSSTATAIELWAIGRTEVYHQPDHARLLNAFERWRHTGRCTHINFIFGLGTRRPNGGLRSAERAAPFVSLLDSTWRSSMRFCVAIWRCAHDESKHLPSGKLRFNATGDNITIWTAFGVLAIDCGLGGCVTTNSMPITPNQSYA